MSDSSNHRAAGPPAGEAAPGEGTGLVAAARGLAEALYGGTLLGSGEHVLAHAQGLAELLGGLRADEATLAAGWLFAAPRHLKDYRQALVGRFGEEVAGLVQNVDRLHGLRLISRAVSQLEQGEERRSQVEVVRKMLLAMAEDVRAVLVRLASRTQTLRFLASSGAAGQRAYAHEALDIYAPLANRLGVWQLKWELEDLSFRFLEPATYKQIARLLDERRVEREAFVVRTIALLRAELQAAGLSAEVAGRPKHIYSIYNKMRLKGRDFTELYDLRGLRILVREEQDCYTALGIVHNLWQPIPEEFDDYIVRPKPNRYRSLHTAVTGPDGRALEVQIRTYEMHRQAELGLAAHWRYKERLGADQDYEQRIAWLREVLAWRDALAGSSEGVDSPKALPVDQTVYVLTPQGRVIDLPQGATAIDFAYHLHTDLGHRCRGARVDGAMVPLDYKLQNGQRVEITAAKSGGPSRDWLRADAGYIASSRARAKVRQWFNNLDLAQTAASGRALIERELRREGRTGASLDLLAGKLGFGKAEDMFLAAGREELGQAQIRDAFSEVKPAPPGPPKALAQSAPAPKRPRGESAILVDGVDGVLCQFARCCRPVPPDPLTGFVTRGRGVSVHRSDCASLAALRAAHPERIVPVQWGGQAAASVYPVDVHLQATDRQGLLRDISEVFSRDRINVVGVNTVSRDGIAIMNFTVEVPGADALRRALEGLHRVNGVFLAQRKRQA